MMASILIGNRRAILGSVYMPSGETSSASDYLAQCMDWLVAEFDSHLQVPFLLGGDWNCPPERNPCAAALSTRGWQIPLHIGLDNEPCPVTHQDTNIVLITGLLALLVAHSGPKLSESNPDISIAQSLSD